MNRPSICPERKPFSWNRTDRHIPCLASSPSEVCQIQSHFFPGISFLYICMVIVVYSRDKPVHWLPIGKGAEIQPGRVKRVNGSWLLLF